ncbi:MULTISPECIES: TetR/AcrR family transcriptional regulator [Nocardia]|uniref:TetR/AcrR family transcriptional regulator n=1 Tax=Nocardia abscessus TaxID=120957 RepID=UPI00189449AC|nr:helix-turn-helix domain-containing protein [Nocardia abscessus]MBF6476501.1 helix-turn-helix transcriptional regulator [Nocardia abscessus]
MPERSPRRRGRPVRVPRDAVVAAATQLLAAEGEQAFSMRRLASELQVSTAALYHHFPTKAALFTAVLGRLANSLRRPALPEGPRERLIAIVSYLIDILHQLPWVADILASGQSGARSALWILEEFVVAARELGASDRQAGYMYLTVWRFVVGELTSRHAAAAHRESEPALPYWSDLTGADQLADFPAVARLLPQWAEVRADFRTEDAVADVIDGLLAGISRRAAPQH